MEVVYDYKEYKGREVALAFGNFDGVHLGHSHVISAVKSLSVEKGIPSAVLTFEPHPASILFNKKDFRLTDVKQKIEFIKNHSIDYLYIINFDQNFAKMTPECFIQEVLVNNYQAKYIVTGYECVFGYKRLGNLKLIKDFAAICDYKIVELNSLAIEDNTVCSSSLIRECLTCGNTEFANKLLGRPYCMSGTVVRGVGRGKKIGFPTINLNIDDDVVKPKFGVYFAKVVQNNNHFYGLVNIGVRPTFEDFKKPILEMYIFDFNYNLYDHLVKIEFLRFLRPEKKFSDAEELIAQIRSDVIEARKLKDCL
ncbi:bifunctional riboflavin kinase/FAD synthetase [Candidatus Mesenet endosymbiont of Phosphuga atrata]|uniref:bifunctional riboflavin kinase/FAD synthetase n=1 Tax=Candidatus Mesenet endosymbiont of Phosphuga atrata TaxID=3066221 RepID=UPI0030CE2F9C